MKKLFLLVITTILVANAGEAQITKKNWMVGGNATLSFFNRGANGGSTGTRTTNITLSPNIGYFFIDKLAGGIRLSYDRSTSKFPPSDNFNKFINYSIGPYVRYYFLSPEKMYNIIIEGSYQFGSEKVETNSYSGSAVSSNKILFAGGPVVYFNSSVGLEFLFNYSSQGDGVTSSRANKFGFGIGFQIHLEKGKH